MEAHVHNESPVVMTPRVQQVGSMFDLPPAEKSVVSFDLTLPLHERDWHVGLIHGPSGSGKSSLARTLWPDKVVTGFDWPSDRSVLDGFPEGMGVKEVTKLLGAVGFSSPPAWVRPWHVLSQGEGFRATMARALAESDDLVVVDEFTSVVDRQVAKVASSTVEKAIRRSARQLIAVSCHHDIAAWLRPDWTLDMADRTFRWECLQSRPPITLDITEAPRSMWTRFAPHHYLAATLPTSAHCFLAWVEDTPVAFNSYRHFPHGRTNRIKMGARTVVLPDFQGLGIAGRFDDWLGQYLFDKGYRLRQITSHPAMVRWYSSSPRWKLMRRASVGMRRQTSTTNRSLRRGNLDARALGTWAFEYTAPTGITAAA